MCAALLLVCFAAGAVRADVTLVGVGTLPGTASDLSGLKGKASDGTPNDRLGGLGSAIAYTGKGNEYVLVSDRGPKDGTVPFACRFHRMTVSVAPGAKEPVALKLTATTLLTREDGKQFNGSLAAFTGAKPEDNLRLDAEGARLSRTGTLFVSDEYGPVVYEFDAKGKRLRALPVPDKFRAPKPGKTPNDELPPFAKTGRQPNRGMEGLAIAPDGSKLYGMMQGPLIQDGGLGAENKRVGLNCRILELDTKTGAAREFAYQLSDPANGISEILAVSATEFLVLERDGLGGTDAKFKKLFRIDISKASDVSAVEALPGGKLPNDIVPVKKEPFFDLLDPKFGIAGKSCPEKFEGLAFGPDLPDGKRLLLISADNDFVAEQPFRVYAFAVDRKDLPTFAPQEFDQK